ncbi:hypothetical protein [Flavobacterium sp. DG2-3]|uniref:hypothetical protein n=1 Tax=Flavobacterium sp. DG2-3 TaxID=3068317 RepID=UPI00273F134B|nr:hypothetical protein [Flavobacterium sp. DG2-3]MDP5199931.1 hypothetical protein [Flavobacterium sp. DG2-3]
MSTIWKIYGEQPKPEENPEKILTEYASLLSKDTNSIFTGIVTETVREETGTVIYALYIVVPELHDYMYRLIEVNIQSIINQYPLEITLYAKDPRNNRTFTCDNVDSFKTKLLELIESPITSGILMHLKTLIEIKKNI